jgi:hypothetical protein
MRASWLGGRSFRRPIVGLGLQRTAPRIERIIHDHAMHEHLVVVREIGGKPQRDREQAAALRREIVPRRIRAAHDDRKLIERRIRDVVESQDRIERAALALMGEFDAFDVIGDRAGFARGRENLAGRHVEKLRMRIDEAADEPGTGNAIDLGPLARDPFFCWCRNLPAHGQMPRLPGRDAAVEIESPDAGAAECRGDGLADVPAVRAVSNDRAVLRQAAQPFQTVFGFIANSADDQPVVGVEGVDSADIHHDRRRCRAEFRIKLIG